MTSSGLLGDTTERDYSRKLQLFNAYAEPELRQAIASLSLTPGMRLLGADCGAGVKLRRLCDPQNPEFALRRADFHFLQTFTLAVGQI